MKKIILGSILTIINFSAWSACSYIFDATEQDLINSNQPLAGQFTNFPTISDGEMSFKTQLGIDMKGHIALSKTILKRLEVNRNTNLAPYGDKKLPNSGILAYELKMKVPNIINLDTLLTTFPSMIGTDMDNGDIFVISPTYNSKEDKGKEFFLGALVSGKSTQYFDITPFETQKTTDGYQNIGIYMNQNTQPSR